MNILKIVLIFFFYLVSFISYSQKNFFNNVLTEENITNLRNYNGAGIKSIVMRHYDLAKEYDTTGAIIQQDFFDKDGNKTESLFYNGHLVAQRNLYEYDELNRLIRILEITKQKTITYSKIVYDENNNPASSVIDYNSGNYAIVKYKYNKEGLLVKIAYEYRFNYKINYISAETKETIGTSATRNSQSICRRFRYYSETVPVIKENANKNIIDEYYKLDARNDLVSMKKMTDGKMETDLSIQYDQNHKITEKIFLSENESMRPYKIKYIYSYY